MASSCWAADATAKGSHGSRTRLSREATTKTCSHEAQRPLPNPKQRMPQVRYDRSSPLDVRRDGVLGDRSILEPAFEVLCDDLGERFSLRPASLVAAGTHRAAVRDDSGPRRRRSQDGDHERTGARTEEMRDRTPLRRQVRCAQPSPEPPLLNRCLNPGDVSAQEACDACFCGRHRLPPPSRTPRFASCGP